MTSAAAPIMNRSPFHPGEQATQERLGVRGRIEPWARKVIRPYMPEQHRAFYAQLPFVVAAARDGGGRPWVTLLTGKPGFIRSPDRTHLEIAARTLPGDALEGALVAGTRLGLLGIELDTRRRNRVNGTITETGPGGLRFEVGQSFGNCPQYITERIWREADSAEIRTTSRPAASLDRAARRVVSTADTFFIASGYEGPDADDETRGMDASHRGGAPGFVKVISDTRLVFPDYAGNNHFNTIGNLVLDPRVGMVFVDFERGTLLQITGRATIDWDSHEVARHPGAQRLVIVDIDKVVRIEAVLSLRWARPTEAVRNLKLVDRIIESEDVVSFEFESEDGGNLPDFEAGQHLPIELALEGHDEVVTRSYSLSNAPGDGGYRISVKREPGGLVSRFLHDHLDIGDVVRAAAPAGDFVLETNDRPIVLVSAGIGVTPMVSMLDKLSRSRDEREVFFIHGTRDGAHHALRDEIASLARRDCRVNTMTFYSRPRPRDRRGVDYDRRGRIDSAAIRDLVPTLDAEFYLCGPAMFLADLTAELEAHGVEPSQIHCETF